MRRFEWDEAKAKSNRREHRVSFEVAKEVFDDPLVYEQINSYVRGEERWSATGATVDLTLLVVVHTSWFEDKVEVVRIISARRADRHERRTYEENA